MEAEKKTAATANPAAGIKNTNRWDTRQLVVMALM